MNYLLKQGTTKKTSQSKPIPGREKEMTRNNAGGFVFKVNSWTQLERFLILGSAGGSYYVGERDLTAENVDVVRACIATDGLRAVKTIVDISVSGRAPKNDPALYALALAASYGPDIKVREAALAALPRVARIGTHLFQFCSFVDGMRGWGKSLRRSVAAWYLDKPAEKLAYQAVKYQSRNGWSHKDLLSLAHPKPQDETHSVILRWIKKGTDIGDNLIQPSIIAAFEEAKGADEKSVIRLIREYGLTREMIPTEVQNSPKVWEALLEKMPLTAMIRTLGRMGSIGLLAPLSDASKLVVNRLADRDYLRKSRVHPIAVLSALLTYQRGAGVRGSLSWTAVPQVVDALNDAFYLAFDNIPPTGKNFYLGVDVSGSMEGGEIAGVPGLTPRMGAAAMAMLTARTEQNYYAAGFSDGTRVKGALRGTTMHVGHGSRYIPSMEPIPISRTQRLDALMRQMASIPMGGTDCALPMLDALHQTIPVDCFIIYTDNETWSGTIHPKQALDQYRQKMGRDAKCIVCGMTATKFSIADPNDEGMLDVVGFDASVPSIIAGLLGAQSEATAEVED